MNNANPIVYFQIDSETKRALTYNQVISNTTALAAGLQKKFNLKMKDVVAVALPNCLDYPIIAMALNLAGAAGTLINPAQTICMYQMFKAVHSNLSF